MLVTLSLTAALVLAPLAATDAENSTAPPPALAATVPAGSPLDGCQVAPAPRGRQYVCRTLTAAIEDHPDAAAAEAARAEMLESLGRGAGATRRGVRLRLAGQDLSAVRVERAGRPGAALAATLPLEQGHRFVGCLANVSAPACTAVLELLLRQPWGAAPLTLAGRAVGLPSGCRAEANELGGRVECGPAAPAGAVQWASAPDAAEAQRRAESLDRHAAERHPRMKKKVELLRDTVPCRVAGVATTCLRQRVAGALLLSASAVVDGEPLVATCVATEAPRDGAPLAPPCALVFGL
jgi:hypothetical protein